MCETLGLSLREAIYSRITESDGCYLLIYSGKGEKLSLLSCLTKQSKMRIASKLIVDFSLRQLGEKLTGERLITVDGIPEARNMEAPESYCLSLVLEEVAKLNDNVDSGRLLVIIDPSSFLFDHGESEGADTRAFDKNLAFHREIAEIAKSTKGISVIFLYDASLLDEETMSNLIRLYEPLESSPGGPTPEELKEEPIKRINAKQCYRVVVVSQQHVMLVDPASESVALLLPVTDAIESALPKDPLNIAHRDMAFTNNYTSRAHSCPYWSLSVGSGCLLDPNVVHAMDSQGRSFIEGYPCITAVDYMISDEKPEEKIDNGVNSKPDENNRNGMIDCVNSSSNTSTAGNDQMAMKHTLTNQRLKSSTTSKTARHLP
jgi:hypothetical protein